MQYLIILSILIFAVTLLAIPQSLSQTDPSTVPGGLIPDDDAVGPVGNVDASYKFDGGFYDKVQELMLEPPLDGDPGVYDGTRYYDVIIVVSRDDGDMRDPDDVAKENKGAIVKRLDLLGARNIMAAESLSFVTASVPIADVPGFSLYDEVYRLGDGELLIESEVDMARNTIHATPNDMRNAIVKNPDGSGIVVGVIDNGIRHNTAFGNRISERVECTFNGCNVSPVTSVNMGLSETSHGTRVSQVLAASGLSQHNGIASGVKLLDIDYGDNPTTAIIAHGIDHAHKNGANIVNMSFRIFAGTDNAFCHDDMAHTDAMDLVINEAVDKGMVAVKSAGNKGYDNSTSSDSAKYQSITVPGCGSNVITVGGINDRVSNMMTMYHNASRGPAGGTMILKPEITAPAYRINTLDYIYNSVTSSGSGTSLAAPQVSATAALMLQIEPELTPSEVKAGLLLGADWKGPIPCTSTQYEQNNPLDNCSHARQPSIFNEANNAASVGILNNVGFGILNTAESLRYVHSLSSYIISDHLDTDTTSKQYRFTVTDTSEPVKVILTWLAHPHGGIIEQASRTTPVSVANLNFTLSAPDNSIIRAESVHQTNEFAVFNPTRIGTYTITVSGSNMDMLNKPVQNYALASTIPLLSIPSANHPPVAESNTLIVSPEMKKIVRFSASDPDDDAITFHISQDPLKGVISTDEFITKTTSRAIYTPDSDFTDTDMFHTRPHDGITSGTFAEIILVAESLPRGSSDVDVDSSMVRDWNTLEVTSGFLHQEYTQTFSNVDYPVSAIHIGSVNMEGVDIEISTTSGHTYTAAIPPSDARMIEFSSPITIQSVTLSADGIDEEAAHDSNHSGTGGGNSINYSDVRMFIGYVPSSCASSGASGSTDASCPVQPTYNVVANPNIAIPDNTRAQDTSSALYIPVNGMATSISVSVDITHPFIGDLKVVLASPDGAETVLHDRTGGSSRDIVATYSSSTHAGLASLTSSDIKGDWVLSVGDYAGSDTGTINHWSVDISYLPPGVTLPVTQTGNTVLFSDDFESGLTKWTETGDGDWTISRPSLHGVVKVPDTDATNMVLHSDDCDAWCTVTLADSLDLGPYQSASLSFWRFMDYGLDRDEYLKVELYDGSTWNTVFHWSPNLGSDDNMWHKEQYDLASYLDVTNFKIRFTTQQSTYSEDVQVDDVTISVAGSKSTPATPAPVTISEDFESGLDSWTQTGNSDWITRAPSSAVPQSATGNTVAYSSNCDSMCIITLGPVDLSSRQSGHLVMDRFVGFGLDSGEYLKVELYDGSAWNVIFDWQASAGNDDNTWHSESYNLASNYLISDLSLRITAKSSTGSEIVMIDNIGISDSAPSPPAPTPSPPQPAASYSVYVADTDDREVLVYGNDGTSLGAIVSARSGGLGKVWDVSFGPDGHLYVSDNTYKKIRKYNGATGSPMGSSSSNAEWASTIGHPNGLVWQGNTLYVATLYGVERFSLSGSSLGYFGDAHRNPSTPNAQGLVSAYDITFCPDRTAHVADRSLGKILHYSSSGTYLGEISGTSSSPPNTYRASGIHCGPAIVGSGTSLFQSGDDRGRLNEINPSSGASRHSHTSLIDEPYGMGMRDGTLYVVNKDDDNVVAISPSNVISVFATGFDDPRGVTIGPRYSGSASGTSGQSDMVETDNESPEFEVLLDGAVIYGLTEISETTGFTVRATDAENDAIFINATSYHIPDAVSFTDYGNGTATVSVNPDGLASGDYAFWVTVYDEHDYEREPFAVRVR